MSRERGFYWVGYKPTGRQLVAECILYDDGTNAWLFPGTSGVVRDDDVHVLADKVLGPSWHSQSEAEGQKQIDERAKAAAENIVQQADPKTVEEAKKLAAAWIMTAMEYARNTDYATRMLRYCDAPWDPAPGGQSDPKRSDDDRGTDYQITDWEAFPKLASIFKYRPRVNVFWTELRQLLRIARADAVKFIADANEDELRKAREEGRREASGK